MQVADGSRRNFKWRSECRPHWRDDRNQPRSSSGGEHSRQSTAKAPWQECAHSTLHSRAAAVVPEGVCGR